MLSGYSQLLSVIVDYRAKKLPFREYKQWLIGAASTIGDELDYEHGWHNNLDAWLEYIEFFYPEEEWYELGCSLGCFLENAIVNEPRPLTLPKDDKVVC